MSSARAEEPKTLDELQKDLIEVKKCIRDREFSMSIRGIIPPLMHQKMLNNYLQQKAQLETQIASKKEVQALVQNSVLNVRARDQINTDENDSAISNKSQRKSG